MDDDKSITEKLTDAVTRAADSVKSTMSHIVDTASQAAEHAMASNAENISGQTVTDDPAQIAATANAQIYLPEAADAAAMPAPLISAPPARKRRRKPQTRPSLRKAPSAKRAVAKKSNKKAGKKTAKKPEKKSATGKTKKSAKKSAPRTTVKRAVKKSAKKTKKKSKR